MHAEAPRSVLVIDDDVPFAETLARALARRGWLPRVAHSLDAAMAAVADAVPDAAIVDLRLDVEDGMSLIRPLREAGPDMRILVLTGYASIATAVKAIKLGADDYLAKPVTSASVINALDRRDSAEPKPEQLTPMSPRRLEWEHLQRVLAEHDGNISATARALGMHRRTLQRKLAKRPSH